MCELTGMVGADISTVSKHLSVLKNAGIVQDEKRGLQVYYSLRAVCAGEFVIPPIAAECMYNPVIAGAASSGRLKVVASNK